MLISNFDKLKMQVNQSLQSYRITLKNNNRLCFKATQISQGIIFKPASLAVHNHKQ